MKMAQTDTKMLWSHDVRH